MTSNAEPTPVHPTLEVRKWDIIDILRREHGHRSYAQLLSPSTSSDITGRPELLRFSTTTTLMYASEMQRNDLPWTRCLPRLTELIAETRRSGDLRADLVFVDPWHTYDDSLESLLFAIDILQPGGHIVVHDCEAYEREWAAASPPALTSTWAGETWRAFVDLTGRLERDWRWWVVDADMGTAVIEAPRRRIRRRERARLRDSSVRVVPREFSPEEAWDWLQPQRRALLQLQEREAWKERVVSED